MDMEGGEGPCRRHEACIAGLKITGSTGRESGVTVALTARYAMDGCSVALPHRQSASSAGLGFGSRDPQTGS